MHDVDVASLVPIGDAVRELRGQYPTLSPSTLRFLEREGLLDPLRTPGGHRLYRPSDLTRVHMIKGWQAQRLSLEEIRNRLQQHADLAHPAALADQFLARVVAGDPASGDLVLEADTLGMPLPQLFQAVLAPTLIEVGRQWQHGALRVGQEHEVTEIVRELIAELGWRHRHPRPAGSPVLAACVAGEHHDLGLRMLIALLRADGSRVHYLGADVDPATLCEEVMARQPATLLLSVSAAERLATIKAAATAVIAVAASHRVRIIVGGQGVRGHEETLRSWGVEALGNDLAASVQAIRAAGQRVS